MTQPRRGPPRSRRRPHRGPPDAGAGAARRARRDRRGRRLRLRRPLLRARPHRRRASSAAPHVLGHESAGRVVAVGERVTKHARRRPRDARARAAVRALPRVPHRRATTSAATSSFLGAPPTDGAFTRYVAMHEDFAHALPDGLSDEAGALMEPLSVALWACEKAGVTAGDRVLVTGAGPIGLLSAQVARARGATEIVVTDVNEHRLELALRHRRDARARGRRAAAGGRRADRVLRPPAGDARRHRRAAARPAPRCSSAWAAATTRRVPLSLHPDAARSGSAARSATPTPTRRRSRSPPPAQVDLEAIITGHFALDEVEPRCGPAARTRRASSRSSRRSDHQAGCDAAARRGDAPARSTVRPATTHAKRVASSTASVRARSSAPSPDAPPPGEEAAAERVARADRVDHLDLQRRHVGLAVGGHDRHARAAAREQHDRRPGARAARAPPRPRSRSGSSHARSSSLAFTTCVRGSSRADPRPVARRVVDRQRADVEVDHHERVPEACSTTASSASADRLEHEPERPHVHHLDARRQRRAARPPASAPAPTSPRSRSGRSPRPPRRARRARAWSGRRSRRPCRG